MFAQLKSFCTSIEQDAQKVRKILSTDRVIEPSTPATGTSILAVITYALIFTFICY